MYDLIIVGGGPAALAAAFYAQSKRLDVLMVYAELGGKTTSYQTSSATGTRPVLPGNEMVDMLILRTTRQSARIIHDHVAQIRHNDGAFTVETASGILLHSRTVVVATGANPQRLEVPGVQHLVRHGLGYSLTTYAQQVVGCRVAVIGATSRSLRGSAEILDTVAHLYLITDQPALPDVPFAAALHRSPRVDVLLNTTVRDVVGFESAKTVVVERDGTFQHLPVDRVFVDLGLRPNTAFLQDLPVLDADGFVLVDEVNATAIAGLFAAGDVAATPFGEQVLLAIGDGVRAAVSAYEYLLLERLENVVQER